MDDNEFEVIRMAVRASLVAVGVTVASVMALFLFAAALSPGINIPGVHLSDVVGRPAGD